MVYILGNDVSHWNIFFVRSKLQGLWDDGHRFLYIKVSQGVYFEDPDWREIHQIATDIGFKVGPYHWVEWRVSGPAQAAWFWNFAKDVDWDMPPMLDVEEKHGSKATNAARVKAVIFDTEELFGKAPIIYTSASAWNGYVDCYVENKLFVAHYTTRLQPLIAWKWEGRGWLIWQYKTVPIDTDRFNGTWDDFLEWIGEEAPPPSDLEERVYQLEESVQTIIDWIQSYA